MSVDQELPWEALGAKSNGFIFLSSGHSIWKLLSVCQIFVILYWLNNEGMLLNQFLQIMWVKVECLYRTKNNFYYRIWLL